MLSAILRPPPGLPPDFAPSNARIFEAVKSFTMTGPERVNSLVESVRYVVNSEIPGAFVECGVWKGGSAMAMAFTLKEMDRHDRDIYLYDTYSGMSAPSYVDVSILGDSAADKYSDKIAADGSSDWCESPLAEVRANVFGTGYPTGHFHFIEGKVEDTIPGILPDKIAILRLDTDWYESTKHELTCLFPLLQPQGVLIIDDYGHWQGARKAVDEYISENQLTILLNRIDVTCRVAIKTHS